MIFCCPLCRVPFHGTRQSLTPLPPPNGRHTRRKKIIALLCASKKHTANYYFAVCQEESTRRSLTSPCGTKKHTANHYFAMCQKKHTAKNGFACAQKKTHGELSDTRRLSIFRYCGVHAHKHRQNAENFASTCTRTTSPLGTC